MLVIVSLIFQSTTLIFSSPISKSSPSLSNTRVYRCLSYYYYTHCFISVNRKSLFRKLIITFVWSCTQSGMYSADLTYLQRIQFLSLHHFHTTNGSRDISSLYIPCLTVLQNFLNRELLWVL